MVTSFDPSATQPDLYADCATELAEAGFDCVQQIGHGGFGVVYRCREPALGRTIAIKVLSAGLDRDNRERFMREEYVMGVLSGHPHIMTVLQVGVTSRGRPYIVMPYCPLGSLESQIRRNGPSDWAWALRVGVKLAGALETAHRSGIVHRDVKPANVLLTDYGEPQLTDFGIARITGGFETTANTIAGSLAFTAPEVLVGDSPTVASDIYSLGATLFCLLNGHAAFERKRGEEVVAQFLRITTEKLPDLRLEGIPEDVCALVEHAMSRRPDERPATAAEFGEQLRETERRHEMSVDDMALLDHASARAPVPTADLPDFRDVGSAAVSKPPSTRRRRLPIQVTSFIGRDRDLARGETLLDTAHLVTLTGPGGVGKTRMAVELAARFERRWSGRVWFVELGSVPDPKLFLDKVIGDLGMADQAVSAADPVHSLVMRIAEKLGDQAGLILVDNCEHLIDECVPLFEDLLHTVAGLRLLVTSRQVLGIVGEHIYSVPPLSLPSSDHPGDSDPADYTSWDALHLFVDRARAVVPGFTVAPDQWPDIARLCIQLDGIPLAIELAAARLRAFGVSEILQFVNDRFQLLAAGNRGADPRHHTLRALVEWSYRLLSPLEQDVWTTTALFSGSFTADAATEVCNRPATETLLCLASLVDKSMLVSTSEHGARRYRILITLRDYGRQRLADAPDRNDRIDRYIRRYERMAEEFRGNWFGPRQIPAYRAVARERENIRAALNYTQRDGEMSAAGTRIATSLFFFWFADCGLSEARRWLTSAMQSTRIDNGVLTRALWGSAILAMLQNDPGTAADHARRARDLAAQRDDPVDRGYAAYALGLIAICAGDTVAAATEYQQALRYQRSAENAQGIAVTVAGLLSSLPSPDDAAQDRLWREAVAICTDAGEKWTLAYLTYARGHIAYLAGDLDLALRCEGDCLHLTMAFSDRILVAWALELTSWIVAHHDDFALAAQLMGAARAGWASGEATMLGYANFANEHAEMDRCIRIALGDRRTNELGTTGGRRPLADIVAEVFDIPTEHGQPVGPFPPDDRS